MTAPVPLTFLYVPGDRPDRVAKAFASRADVVVIDLEDSVTASHKQMAREALSAALGAADDAGMLAPGRAQVRINAVGSRWHVADVDALRSMRRDVVVRMPKMESPGQLDTLEEAMAGRRIMPLIESALGVERAFDIASHPAVVAIGLGEADLSSDLGVSGDDGLRWARGRIINAARAAHLPAPAMSVYANVRDLTGLRASCDAGRALGFVGRSAIHPAQLPVIRAAFTPSAAQVKAAAEVLRRLADAESSGVGAIALPDGTFLDAAMVEHARTILRLAQPESAPRD